MSKHKKVPEAANLGVFVGIIAVGRQRYETVVLHTCGGKVTSMEVPFESGDHQGQDGRAALMQAKTLFFKEIQSKISELWEKNPSLNTPSDELTEDDGE